MYPSLTFSSSPFMFVYVTPVFPFCFSLASLPLVANLASIFSCFLSFILKLLFSEILPPFSVSLVFPFALLISKIASPFSISFLLSLPLLVSYIASPFSISFLLSLPLLVSYIASRFSISFSLPFPLLVCAVSPPSIALCRSLPRFLCLSLSLYSKLEDIINKNVENVQVKTIPVNQYEEFFFVLN